MLYGGMGEFFQGLAESGKKNGAVGPPLGGSMIWAVGGELVGG